MLSEATISAWSIEAFLNLTGDEPAYLSPEIISRINAFIEAYVLFDKIFLPYRTGDYLQLKGLDGQGEIFDYINPNKLAHSTQSSRFTLELDLGAKHMASLVAQDRYWFLEHDPDFGEKLYERLKNGLFMTNLRIWQYGLVNEVSELTGAVSLMPLSLAGISGDRHHNPIDLDYIYERFQEFSEQQKQRIARVLVYDASREIIEISNVPPLFLRLIDACKDPSDLFEKLGLLRNDYSELRDLRRTIACELKGLHKLKEREDVIRGWDDGWGVLLKNEFRKPSLLRRKISSTEMASGAISPTSDGIKTIFSNVLEHWKERKLARRYGFFEADQSAFDNIELDSKMMKKLRIKGVKHQA